MNAPAPPPVLRLGPRAVPAPIQRQLPKGAVLGPDGTPLPPSAEQRGLMLQRACGVLLRQVAGFPDVDGELRRMHSWLQRRGEQPDAEMRLSLRGMTIFSRLQKDARQLCRDIDALAAAQAPAPPATTDGADEPLPTEAQPAQPGERAPGLHPEAQHGQPR